VAAFVSLQAPNRAHHLRPTGAHQELQIKARKNLEIDHLPR
jgi:hypothetical protein